MNIRQRVRKFLGLKNSDSLSIPQRGAENTVIVNKVSVRPIHRKSQDIESWRNALQTAEARYQNRTRLFDLYHDILLDGFLKSVIDKRVRAVTNRDLRFTIDGEDIEEVSRITQTAWFAQFLRFALESRFWGHSLMEPQWPSFGEDLEGTTHLIPRKHVKPRYGIVTKYAHEIEGVDYTGNLKDQVIEAGGPEDLGLLLQAAQYVIYKRGNMGDWVEYAEIFGMPFRWATYNNETSREVLETALQEAGSAGYVVAPEDAQIQFLNANTQGGHDLYRFLRMACNEELSVLILGNTMTTTEARQSGFAQGKVHQMGQDEIHKDDRRFILRILQEKVVPFLERLGYPVKDGRFSFVEEDTLSPAQRIDIDLKVASQVPIPASYWYNKYHIPAPTEDDPPANNPKPPNEEEE